MTGETRGLGAAATDTGSGQVPELSVVIPVHNEAASIEALIAETADALDGRVSFEIVVVNDASNDATGSLLAKAAATEPRLRVVRHARQAGQSAALISGVRFARAAWIATMDGDGQNDPADIRRLMEVRDAAGPGGALLVAGHRHKRHDTAFKRLQSRIANRVRGRLLKDGTPDTGCGLKLFPRGAFLSLPHFNHVHRFLPALFLRQGGRVVSQEVGHRPRRGGASHYGMWGRLTAGLIDLLGVMWLQRRSVVVDAQEQPVSREDSGQ